MDSMVRYIKTICPHIIYACLLVTLFGGCRSKWPEIEYEGNPSEVVFGHIASIVPINVAISDPLYESYTRGVGVFDNLQNGVVGEDNWKNADIYVYAFYSPNDISGGPDDLNYSERMNSEDDEKIFCLVDDAEDENIGHGKRARLNRDMGSFLQWNNDMVYYNGTYQQYRYKFFAYHVDDAADLTRKPERWRDYVAYDVKIDGTQDLMCSCASPTKKQLATLNTTGNKHIINNFEQLAYSTTTGHHDLFPIFRMEHQLAYVKFFLKADSVVSPDGSKKMDPEVKNVRIRNIVIKAPYHGEFIVAADDITRLGVTFTDETKDIYMPVRVEVDAEGNLETDDAGRRITVSRGEEGRVMAGDGYGFNPRIVPEPEEKELGMGFLLPPSESYEMELECSQVTTDDRGNQVESDYYTSRYQLKFENSPFKAGHIYEVCIKVYGQRDIGLGFGDVTWKDGGEINIGSEDEDKEDGA